MGPNLLSLSQSARGFNNRGSGLYEAKATTMLADGCGEASPPPTSLGGLQGAQHHPNSYT